MHREQSLATQGILCGAECPSVANWLVMLPHLQLESVLHSCSFSAPLNAITPTSHESNTVHKTQERTNAMRQEQNDMCTRMAKLKRINLMTQGHCLE